MASEIKWIKLTTDMFEDEKLDFISSLPESDALIVIWIRLLTMAGKCNAGGYVFLTERIPYTDEMLAHKFKKPINVVRLALETFQRLEMIELDNAGRIYFPNWEKHQNIDGMEKIREQTRKRVEKHREKKQISLSEPTCNVTVADDVTPTNAIEVEEDKELDKEKDLSSATTSTDPKTVDEAYVKVFRRTTISSIMGDFIVKTKKMGYTDAFIIEVMLEAGESSENPNKRLIESIAARWMREGIYTRVESRRRKELTLIKGGQANATKSEHSRYASASEHYANDAQGSAKGTIQSAASGGSHSVNSEFDLDQFVRR